MSAYLQLGHESWRLLQEDALGKFAGIVLSPVNDDPDYVGDRLARLGNTRAELEVILDPQFYNPRSEKAKLASWSFFPSDFETQDRGDPTWWTERAREVVEVGSNLGVECVCSPAAEERLFPTEYYQQVVEVADRMQAFAASRMQVLVTALVSLRDLINPRKALEVASVLSRSRCQRVYLVFCSESSGRTPIDDSEALPGAVHLIRLLSQDMRVHVAFSSHEVMLWKAAGAADASSGKWLNTRRYSPGRWVEEESGGRIVPYWNEGGLLTLLREQDVKRLDRDGYFDDRSFEHNPAGKEILDVIREGKGRPWQKLSWLQYLRWFRNAESRFGDADLAESFLERADNAWNDVAQRRILFSERFNDGSWVRTWLNAVREGKSR